MEAPAPHQCWLRAAGGGGPWGHRDLVTRTGATDTATTNVCMGPGSYMFKWLKENQKKNTAA